MFVFCTVATDATDAASEAAEQSGDNRGMPASAEVAHDIAVSTIGFSSSWLEVAMICESGQDVCTSLGSF
jgi:hypothetical protein